MVHNGETETAKDAIIDFIAGSLGGVALVYVGQPFDTVKVKMQAFPTMYTGMIDCFKTTFVKDGIARGLYAGTIPALVANVAENAVLFAGYGFCQKIIMKLTNKSINELTVFENATSGFFAAFGSSLVLCPTELIKCKLQAIREMQTSNNVEKQRIGAFSLTKQIIQTDGLTGMFKGITPTIIREMPGYFFFFGGYEGARELLRVGDQTKDEIGPIRTMFSGAIGGIVFWLSTFPADVVKSRIQITGHNPGVIKVTSDIFRNEGFLALYNGLLPTIVRTIPATATLFVVYEYSKKVMNMLF